MELPELDMIYLECTYRYSRGAGIERFRLTPGHSKLWTEYLGNLNDLDTPGQHAMLVLQLSALSGIPVTISIRYTISEIIRMIYSGEVAKSVNKVRFEVVTL